MPELDDVSDPLTPWQSVFGYDVYIWEHIEDKRSVAFRDPVEMSCRRAEKQKVECRGRAPIEVELEWVGKRPVPENRVWPGSK